MNCTSGGYATKYQNGTSSGAAFSHESAPQTDVSLILVLILIIAVMR